jgi:hypothetical protein
MPIAFVGAACLLLARSHIERDSAKVLEAVVRAMAENEADEASYAAGPGAASGPLEGGDDEVGRGAGA